MELTRKIVFAILPILCLSCKTTMGSIAMQEIKPLPREVVIATPIEYDPIYTMLKIREVAEENGVQKYLYAKLDGDISEITAGVMGEISVEATFSEIIGTFKVISKDGGFVRGSIESLTYKVPSNSFIRIQTGQKAKEVK